MRISLNMSSKTPKIGAASTMPDEAAPSGSATTKIKAQTRQSRQEMSAKKQKMLDSSIAENREQQKIDLLKSQKEVKFHQKDSVVDKHPEHVPKERQSGTKTLVFFQLSAPANLHKTGIRKREPKIGMGREDCLCLKTSNFSPAANEKKTLNKAHYITTQSHPNSALMTRCEEFMCKSKALTFKILLRDSRTTSFEMLSFCTMLQPRSSSKGETSPESSIHGVEIEQAKAGLVHKDVGNISSRGNRSAHSTMQ